MLILILVTKIPKHLQSVVSPFDSLLLQAGADPNEPDLEKWTPLHAAAHWGSKEACKLLADYGADFTLRNHVVS